MRSTAIVRRSAATRKRPAQIIYSAAGKPVGSVRTISGRVVLYKSVIPREHQLRKPPAWGCDVTVLTDAEHARATHILLKERTAGRFWAARFDLFRKHTLPAFDRGHGLQVALPLGRWASGFDAARVLAEADLHTVPPATSPTPRPEVRVVQSDLFGTS